MGNTIRTALLAVFVLAPASAQTSDSDRLVHLGENAPGTVSVYRVGTVCHLKFTGDEVIDYQVDLANPGVAHGMYRVYEGTSHCYPIWEGGPGYRQASGVEAPPAWLAQYSTLVSSSISGNSLVLVYRDTLPAVEGVVLDRRHTFTLRGKTLSIRAQDLGNSTSWTRNYCGVYAGRTDSTEAPIVVRMQGALATPITLFRDGAAHYFLGEALDLPQSNAADWVWEVQGHTGPGVLSIVNGIHSFNTYKRQGGGQICAPMDDTLIFTVSSKIKDVMLTPSQRPSPYLELLKGRTIALLGGTNWSDYTTMWNLYDQWGMQDLAGYFFIDWVDHSRDDTPLVGGTNLHQNFGPDWWPALNSASFGPMVHAGRDKGWLLGAYMAFSDLPPTSPYASVSSGDLAHTDVGGTKADLQNGFPLISASGSRSHALREAGLVARDYGLNSAYLDIQTYASPSHGADGDHIEQASGSPWARTLRSAIRDQKTWMRRMTDTYEGPMLGEGSIATAPSNMEWLWAGYCDSVQRVINSGSGLSSSQMAAGNPDAPTNWPVVPEYEQRVMSRLQCNHGNGFQDRFFSRSDGPSMVNTSTGLVLQPGTTAALDRYRAYEITYAHASYIFTNGPYNAVGNWTYFADVIKEYYMMNALQALYFEMPARTIQYEYNGALRPFEEILFATETLDTFRNPRIRLAWPNGLEVFVNHSTTPWTRTVGSTTYTIAEDGFVASQPATGFLAFSAIAPGTAGARVDYCYAPHRWEYFDGRGTVNGYGGIDTLGRRRMRLHNFVTDSVVYEDASNHAITTVPGNPPALTSIEISPSAPDLLVGERIGMRAIAHYSNGALRNVSSLVTWRSTNPGVARMNHGAAVTAVGTGTTSLYCEPYLGVSSTPATLTVQ